MFIKHSYVLPYVNIAKQEVDVKQYIRVMKALSDPNRVKIIKMLEKKEMCVCELTAALGLAQPTVSKHLKQLEDAELVGSRKDGPWVNYSLAEEDSPYATAMLKQTKKSKHWKCWKEHLMRRMRIFHT